MTYTLVIVESPAKCKKIESYLGSDYKCVASFGHIRELDTKHGLKCIDIANNFSPQFKLSSGKSKQISHLRECIRSSREVLLATDDDREGEAIAWHICKVFKLPIATTKRIIFREITKSALQQAVANPTRVNMDKVNAQLARQVLDLLVGFTISPLLWKHITKFKKASLSAGRCQTPALRLVYENQQDIDAHPGKEGYSIQGQFTSQNITFTLHNHIPSKEETETFLEETVNHDHIFNRSPIIQTKKTPPQPFTTSAIQQRASNVCGFSPKRTMSLCQALYEAGYITYMRTDSKTYSKEFIDTAKNHIISTYGESYVNPTIDLLSSNESKVTEKQSKKSNKTSQQKNSRQQKNVQAQEAHEAIRPTLLSRTTLTPSQKIDNAAIRLYQLIWNNSVESCMSDATYKTLRCSIQAPMGYVYKHTSEQIVFPGWKIVQGYEETSETFSTLQKLKKNSIVPYAHIDAKYTLYDVKQHYTEAKLVSLLEKRGIGRPSTFSSIISKIQDREYVVKQDVPGKQVRCIDFTLENDEIDEIEQTRTLNQERQKMVITPTGQVVIEFLLKYFDDLFNYEYTKNMEHVLDVISQGDRVWHSLCEECNNEMSSILSSIQDKLAINYEIDEHHTYMIGRYGPVIRTRQNDKVVFLKVKPDITLSMIQNGSLAIDDIVEKRSASQNTLGDYNGEKVCVKKGKFGIYAQVGAKTVSLKHLKKEVQDISLADVISVLTHKNPANKNILRVVNEDISIRNGKYGRYVYYKTKEMNRPKFIPLKDFEPDPLKCETVVIERWVVARICDA